MFYVEAPRWKVVHHLPKGGLVAEIGVLKGDFSEKLLHILRPSELHLIDPWIHHSDSDYDADFANKTQDIQDKIYQSVHERFKEQIAAGIVKIHRKMSIDAAHDFPDDYFDFVYIDAMHHYAAVLADLNAFAKKVKEQGLLAGHDICEHSASASMNFGVVSAVGTFIRRSDFKCILLTGQEEEYPSYVLCRKANPDWLRTVLYSLMDHQLPFIEVPDALLPNFHHIRFDREGQRPTFVPSFA